MKSESEEKVQEIVKFHGITGIKKEVLIKQMANHKMLVIADKITKFEIIDAKVTEIKNRFYGRN